MFKFQIPNFYHLRWKHKFIKKKLLCLELTLTDWPLAFMPLVQYTPRNVWWELLVSLANGEN